jgi:hypothetical protein
LEEDEMGRAWMDKRNAYRILAGKIPVGRPGRRWEYNIKMDLIVMVWTLLITLRIGIRRALVKTVMNPQVL